MSKKLVVALAAAITMAMAAGSASATDSAQGVKPAANGHYAPRTERGRLAGQLVRTWSGYVGKVYGRTPMAWANGMASTFATADLGNMRRAASMQTYEAMMATLLGQRTSDAQVIDKLARSNGSRAVIMALGSPALDLVYTMVTPCRIADTRLAGGVINAGGTRDFIGYTATTFSAQGGAASDCGIPANPSALVLNITVVRPAGTGYGNLTAFPFGVTRPTASSLNFLAGAITGNEVIVKQTIGNPNFSIYTNAKTHVVVDVAGYFMAPLATALDCTTVASAPVSIAAGANGQAFLPSCAAGYTRTGIACTTGSFDTPLSGMNAGNGCVVKNNSAAAIDAIASSICCRVPGR